MQQMHLKTAAEQTIAQATQSAHGAIATARALFLQAQAPAQNCGCTA
jgi:hypothetical protein